MRLLLKSFSLVLLLVGICAEMDDSSFEFVQSVPLLVGVCVEMDETSFEFI